jgi:IclR family transcriptional regulator, mhp operon transcriptional activator
VRDVKVKSVRSLERGLRVLEAVRANDPATLALIHQRTALPRATILRSLRTLEENGWISTRAEQSTYRPGPKLASPESGRIATVAELAAPVLEELGRRVPWPTDVAVRQGTRMAIVNSSRRVSHFIINRKTEGRRPCMLWSALGRAYLAFCPQTEREQVLAQLQRSTDPDDRPASVSNWVTRMLRQTRERGYALREVGYWATAEDGVEVSSIALPVHAGGQLVAAINIVWLAGTHDVTEFAAENLGSLRAAASALGNAVERTQS